MSAAEQDSTNASPATDEPTLEQLFRLARAKRNRDLAAARDRIEADYRADVEAIRLLSERFGYGGPLPIAPPTSVPFTHPPIPEDPSHCLTAMCRVASKSYETFMVRDVEAFIRDRFPNAARFGTARIGPTLSRLVKYRELEVVAVGGRIRNPRTYRRAAL